MANSLCVEKANESRLQRLPFLPRIGVVVDFGGRQFVYRHAPILEALVNMRKTGFSLRNLLDISFEQLKEIKLPDLPSKLIKNPSSERKSSSTLTAFSP
jgi:hypothetical protein